MLSSLAVPEMPVKHVKRSLHQTSEDARDQKKLRLIEYLLDADVAVHKPLHTNDLSQILTDLLVSINF